MLLAKLNTPLVLPILLVDATDGYTPEPGLAPTVTIRKVGGAWAAAGGAAPVDRTVGSYEYTPTAAEFNTLGIFEYRAVAAGARDYRGLVEIVEELPGNIKNGGISAGTFLADAINAAVLADNAITAAKIANGAIDAATFAAGAIDAAAIATGAIDADAIAADAVAEIQTGLATSAAVAAVQADTDNIQTRIPAALVGGRMDSHVNVMGNGTIAAATFVAGAIDAAAIATDAIDADAVAASAVAELQAGLATAAAVAALPTAAQNADAVWDEALAGHLAAGSTGEALNASGGGATPSQIADAVWDEARADHVAAGSFGQGVASVQGAVTGSVGSVGAGGITAASLAADAITAAKVAADVGTEIAAAVGANLSAAHGAGSWEGGGGDLTLLEQEVALIKGLVNGNVVRDQFVYDAGGLLTSCRTRVFPTAADAIAGTNVLATFTVTATNGINGPTNFRSTQS